MINRSVFVFAYLVISVFFPVIVYAPIVFFVGLIIAVVGSDISDGFRSISYFSALPVFGVFLYCSLSSSMKLSLKFISSNNAFVEYLGCFLVVGWYVANNVEFYLSGDLDGGKVVVPVFQSPITSCGLWLSGIAFGVVLSMLVHRIFSRKI